MPTPKSNEVATTSNTGTGVTRRASDNLKAKLNLAAGIDGAVRQSGAEISARVMDEMEVARTVDDLFDAQQNGNVEDLIGETLNVQEVAFYKSDEKYAKQEGSLGTYVSVAGVKDNGDSFSFNTGATNVVAFMFKADDLGKISKEEPLRCKITAKDTQNGTLYKVARP